MSEIYKSTDGNLLIANCNLDDKQILIVGIYGPNADTPSFYDKLEEKLEEFSHDRVVICGDFNVTLNHRLDNYGYIGQRSRERLNRMMGNLEICDAFRAL